MISHDILISMLDVAREVESSLDWFVEFPVWSWKCIFHQILSHNKSMCCVDSPSNFYVRNHSTILRRLLDIKILILQWPQKHTSSSSIVTEFPIPHLIKLWKSSEIEDLFLYSFLSHDYQILNMKAEWKICCSLSHNRKYLFPYHLWETETSNARDLIWMWKYVTTCQ
jgi:hypothetical protein